MDHLGIDVHKKESQIYIQAEGGALIEQRIRTSSRRYSTKSAQSWYIRKRVTVPSNLTPPT